ncbi:hypothetical protein GMOD_00009755 [Pyrenophora seminiperda CCB06]|uniref:Uncharacterized protein n=1 Tax=Pyrenophora seminiperda CCB06 TaxID=1302712 RepID=A0A3M7MEU9_9PLEO|nr:hypothetical protein GMOD_00009755 [Pyrenophora seminiperda CCB06]
MHVSISSVYRTPPHYSPRRQHQDGASVLLQTGTDGRHGARLGCRARHGSELPQLVKCVDIGNSHLSKQARLVHHGNSLDGVVTLGSLTGQHDAVGTVKNRVTNVADFGTRWARVVRHRLEHLRSANDGLTRNVALCDHHLLCNEDLAGWNLNTKITTGDHDTVGFPQNLIKVVHTLLVLDLGNDLDVLALLTEHLADGSNVAAAADKGRKYHVDLVLDTELEIGLVLLR